jgi:hypothetical protein
MQCSLLDSESFTFTAAERKNLGEREEKSSMERRKLVHKSFKWFRLAGQ